MSKAAQLVPFSSYMEAFLGHLVDRFNFFPPLHLCGGMSVDAQGLPHFRLRPSSFYDCNLKCVGSEQFIKGVIKCWSSYGYQFVKHHAATVSPHQLRRPDIFVPS